MHSKLFCNHSKTLSSGSTHSCLSCVPFLYSHPPPSYSRLHNWGLCHSCVFQSTSPLWLPSLPYSVWMPWPVISAALHWLIYHLLVALTFFHSFLVLLPFPLVSSVLCSPLSPAPEPSLTSHFVQSLWVTAALHTASITTQILMSLSVVSPAWSSPPEL